jgi:hypothetical protein
VEAGVRHSGKQQSLLGPFRKVGKSFVPFFLFPASTFINVALKVLSSEN